MRGIGMFRRLSNSLFRPWRSRHKKPRRKDESLKVRGEADLANLKTNRGLLRSFFKADSVVYTND